MARHILRYEEWECGGYWYCNDINDLTGIGSLWWTPARMLNIAPVEYVKLIIEKFHPDYVRFFNKEKSVFVYAWKNINDMRKFKNWLNAEARKKQFFVG